MFNEREILNAVEEVIAELGKFSPSEHANRVRESSPQLKRIKERVFEKQLRHVWNKHGNRLKNEVKKASMEVHESMEPQLKGEFKIPNGTPEALDRKRIFYNSSIDEADLTTIDSEDSLDYAKKPRKRQKIGSDQKSPGGGRFEPVVPNMNFDDLGGLEEVKEAIVRQFMHLLSPQIYTALGVKPPSGILLHGPPGTGKTLLAKSTCGQLGINMIDVNTTELISDRTGGSEKNIREIFESAANNAPCVVFLDEIDSICQSREDSSREMTARIIAQLVQLTDNMHEGVLLVGATSRPDTIDTTLRRTGRFDTEIIVGIPNEKERYRIIQVVCRYMKLESNFNFLGLARLTPGYVASDFVALVREAAHEAIERASRDDAIGWRKWTDIELDGEELRKITITFDDFKRGVARVVPSAKREGFATVPDVTWNDIGALENLREELSLAILAPVKNPIQFSRLGLTRPSGILLTGPPGCGKTLVAKAIANESGLNFISVKGPELLNMYVGESERAVRKVFQRARSSKPCVIFFDEIDALAPRRQENSNSGSARVVNQLLTEMDGLEDRKHVFIMGATNRYEIIDPAILRPGRFDKTLFVGLPSSEDKMKIFQKATKNFTQPPINRDVNLNELISKTVNYSGADITALIREASLLAARETLIFDDRIEDEDELGDEITVTSRHLFSALESVKCSISEKDILYYDKLYRKINTLK